MSSPFKGPPARCRFNGSKIKDIETRKGWPEDAEEAPGVCFPPFLSAFISWRLTFYSSSFGFHHYIGHCLIHTYHQVMSMSKKQKTSATRAASVESSLIHVILSQTFGPIIGDVGRCLYQSGPSPLMVIVSKTGRGIKNVKKSLMVLIQHQLVQVILHPKGFLEYSCGSLDTILALFWYPNYVLMAKRR